MNEVIKSKYHNIKLVCTDWDEPNNGRMLRIADLYINDELKNREYFGNWNRLNQNIDNYVMDSLDGKYVYVPAEGGGFLIDVLSLTKIDMPYKSLSTITFIRNEFTIQNLSIIYTDEIIIVNLANFEVEVRK